MTSAKAIILVGGPSRGTRFRPLSMTVPKPLFPVAGHPIIWHHLQALARVQDLKEVILVGFYEESVFTSFIKEASEEFPSMTIKYLREYQALGTAGGLYLFRDAILKNSPSQIFVLHADVCCSFPLTEMQKLHTERGAQATMLGTKVTTEAATNFGCIVSDPATGEVLHYVEKPESYISNMINCGVYLFDASIFGEIKAAMKAKADGEKNTLVLDPLDQNDERLRLEQDILAPLAQKHRVFVYETKGFWRQIKTAGSAVPANALYLQKAHQSPAESASVKLADKVEGVEIVHPVYIHPSASVAPGAKLGPNVSIGAKAKIGAGARVKDSIILPSAEVGHDSSVLHSIIAWDSRVGNWARVEGTPTLPGSHVMTVLRGGVKVQSITILAQDVIVADEVMVQNCVVLPHKELKRDVVNEVIM